MPDHFLFDVGHDAGSVRLAVHGGRIEALASLLVERERTYSYISLVAGEPVALVGGDGGHVGLRRVV